MATNLAVDPELLERAVEVSGAKSKTAAVTQALIEFIARREQARLLDLFGTLEWNADYDYKRERSRKCASSWTPAREASRSDATPRRMRDRSSVCGKRFKLESHYSRPG